MRKSSEIRRYFKRGLFFLKLLENKNAYLQYDSSTSLASIVLTPSSG